MRYPSVCINADWGLWCLGPRTCGPLRLPKATLDPNAQFIGLLDETLAGVLHKTAAVIYQIDHNDFRLSTIAQSSCLFQQPDAKTVSST